MGGIPIAGWFKHWKIKNIDDLGVPPWIGNFHVSYFLCIRPQTQVNHDETRMVKNRFLDPFG